MSRQPRFVEVEDDADDPEELDIPGIGGNTSLPAAFLSPEDYPQPTFNLDAIPTGEFKTQMISATEMEQFKRWSCIYPVYFDSSRSIREGRKVPIDLAVKNPLGKIIADACASLNIQCVFEVRPVTHSAYTSQTKHIRKIGQIQDGFALHTKPHQAKNQRHTRRNMISTPP
jgi:signal recognition particle subunit SRP19